MLAEYKYIDDEPREIVKPITKVRFKADYDITDVLRLWGNWSRKDYYEEQKTPNFYNEQKKQHKEVCSDNDGLLIDSILISLSKTGSTGREQFEVLKLFYFGERQIIEDCVPTTGVGRELMMTLTPNDLSNKISVKNFNRQSKNIIMPLNVVDIAKKMGIDRAKIKSLKEGGENHIVGHLSALTLLTGKKLEILEQIKFL